MSEEEKLIKEKIEDLKEYLVYGMKYSEYLNVVNAFEYIENKFKSQQKEIEKYKMLQRQSIAAGVVATLKDSTKAKEDLEMLNEGWRIELEKKDKIIDEMAEYLAIIRDCPNEDKGANIDCENRCSIDDDIYAECWKLYFERKSGNER